MDKVITTLKDMIEQRHYTIKEETNDMIICVHNSDIKLIVFKNVENKFNIERVKEYMGTLHEMKINHCIIIYDNTVTPSAKKLIQHSFDVKIELFCVNELKYNITKHRLVPLHEQLTEEESIAFKKQWGIKYPILLMSDPVVRFYNFIRGRVIRITRTSKANDGTIMTYITHRITR